jgi:hypothetical protein
MKCKSKKGKKGYMDGGMVSPRKSMAMGFQMGGNVDINRANLFAQNLGQAMQSPMVVRKPKGMM